ncbi:MAG: hypothetical protein KAI67_00360 [Candidatus Pacebacteria bacterium]|nr:hypothetical protein [Candidatus Paceibacterota bacterium]
MVVNISKDLEGLLPEIKRTVEYCQRGLWNSSLEHVNGVYNVGDFEVKSQPMYPGHSIWSFKYLKAGSGDEVTFSSFEGHQSLSVDNSEGSIEISNRSFQKIGKLVKIDPNQTGFYYPHVEFTWVGGKNDELDEGDLKSVRVSFSQSRCVTYFHMDSLKYGIYNPQREDINEAGLPTDLNMVSEILGVSFEKWIDFDVERRRIFDNSNLQALADKIDQLVK